MYKVVSIIPILALTILAGFFISGGVHATGASSDTEVILDVDSLINISAPNIATLECTPGATAAAASLCTTSVTIGVGTNNPTGYTLQMNATNGSSNALTNTGISPAATIPTLSQAYSSANFPANYWGYTGGLNKSSVTGGYNCYANYCPILAYNSDSGAYAPNHAIKVTNTSSLSSNTSISFGAKVDISKPSGTYTTSVTFTAVTNEIPITTMQGFNSAACANATTDQTFTLADARDSKEYTIAKLQDGNCWMTQNLALGGSSAMTLTPADTNVASNFTLPASVSEGSWAGSYNSPEFFDYAGNYSSQQASNKYGNYYNWSAATAGSSNSSGDAQYSICPKNWRLPFAGTATATGNEFYNMLDNYITTGYWDESEVGYECWAGVTTSNFTSAPVSLPFSGGYYYYYENQGSNGYFWSSTSADSIYAYYLDTRSDGYIYPRNDSGKEMGYSVRCMVPGQ